MGTASAGIEENTAFWARQFAGRWYRGPAHMENDFRRFAAAYRVPPYARARVRALVAGWWAAPAERCRSNGFPASPSARFRAPDQSS